MGFYRGPNIITDGLVLALDAGNIKSYQSGSLTWYDKSGNGKNGTLVNGPTFNNGSGGSIVFDGTNDYVTSSLDMNTLLPVWTAEVLLNTSSATGYQGIFGGPYSATVATLYLKGSLFGIYTSGDHFGSVNVSLNTWYHLAIVLDSAANTLKSYINGVLDINASYGTGVNFNTNYTIGKNPFAASERFNGNIAITRLYNRILSQEEILQNYNATKGRFI